MFKPEISKYEFPKTHPEMMEDEVYLGNYEMPNQETGRWDELQEVEDRQKFEDLPWRTKRRGTVFEKGGVLFYPLFVKKSEYENKDDKLKN